MEHNEKLEDLDALILEEKRNVAREHFHQYWEQALEEVIDHGIVAEELISGVFEEIAKFEGDEHLSKMIDQLKLQHQQGKFLPIRTIQ